MNYEESVAFVGSLATRSWRQGLDRMREFCRRAGVDDALGGPTGPQYLHVAGTNGKGSVTAYLQSLLVEMGHRTGAYFSPYVYDIRERIQLGRDLIPRDDWARIVSDLAQVAAMMDEGEMGPISEFEFKTAMGFRYWRDQGCDWVALEVGLGGRLDATNVVLPQAGAIVSIGLDHINILGDTIEAIAREKAGIAKPGVPLVVGQVPPSALAAIEEVAHGANAPVFAMGREFSLDSGSRLVSPWGEFDHLTPSLYGVTQPHNMAVALACALAAGLRPDAETARRAMAQAVLPGRFERRALGSQTWILDGAHNPESAIALAATLWEALNAVEGPPPRVRLLAGMVGGHDPLAFFTALAPLVDEAHFAPIDFYRALAPHELSTLTATLFPRVFAHATLEDALNALNDGTNDWILVSGSFYLVGAVGNHLQDLWST